MHTQHGGNNCLIESALLHILFVMGRLRNPKRERFAVEVASMVPVDRAYMLAGFRSKPQWARPNGSKLAHVKEVAARIMELREQFAAGCSLQIEYLQRSLLPTVEANVVDYFEADKDAKAPPKLKKLTELTREQGAAISTIKFNDDGSVAELKFYSKPEAVNVLMRSIGAIVERHEVQVPIPGLADRLNAARLRAAWRLDNLNIDDQLALADALDEVAPATIQGNATTVPER